EDIKFCDKLMDSDYLQYKAENNDNGCLCVKTKSHEVMEYLPYFAKLLQLCRERGSLYNRLQELSVYDPLTKMYNRRNFMKRYLEEFERMKRFKLSLSFLMIDIDFFKKVNDTYGHLVGDAVLIKVSRLIKINLREMDFVARMGGEEFAVILPQTDKSEAAKIAERIRLKIFDEEIKVFDELFNISISIGISSFPADTENQEILMEFADKALYTAKDSGRNKVCLFSL
ncbi:MAG: GGDEF domain-containing protein, partial [Candidatus Omnitrophica bacterium]|nr:GGDEF domain-containing protein [Candidatus Omnitrophota bacterium]